MIRLTMLNSMAGADFISALDTHHAWGIEVLDLKNEIFGKSVVDLTEREAVDAANLIRERGMSVYCFSTELFYDDIEKGEAEFRDKHLAKIVQTLEVANILKPAVIRLLAARTMKRSEITNSADYIKSNYPWLIPMYREAVDRIAAAGFHATIENECHECIFAYPEEILQFFEEMDRPNTAYFTYDVQNLWEMGTFPSLEVYQKLAPITGYYHVKGGQTDGLGQKLVWSSSLEDASWPVIEMTTRAVKDGISPVLCLNPSHGKKKGGYDYANVTKRDLDFLRKMIPGVK